MHLPLFVPSSLAAGEAETTPADELTTVEPTLPQTVIMQHVHLILETLFGMEELDYGGSCSLEVPVYTREYEALHGLDLGRYHGQIMACRCYAVASLCRVLGWQMTQEEGQQIWEEENLEERRREFAFQQNLGENVLRVVLYITAFVAGVTGMVYHILQVYDTVQARALFFSSKSCRFVSGCRRSVCHEMGGGGSRDSACCYCAMM